MRCYVIKKLQMDEGRSKELRRFVESEIYTPKKREAKELLKRLEFMASSLKENIDG